MQPDFFLYRNNNETERAYPRVICIMYTLHTYMVCTNIPIESDCTDTRQVITYSETRLTLLATGVRIYFLFYFLFLRHREEIAIELVACSHYFVRRGLRDEVLGSPQLHRAARLEGDRERLSRKKRSVITGSRGAASFALHAIFHAMLNRDRDERIIAREPIVASLS